MRTPIELNLEQGSDAWIQARLGIPTGSRFSSLITSTGRKSYGETVDRLLGKLLKEWLIGMPADEWQGNDATDYGKAQEPRAFDWYRFVTGATPRKTGLVYGDSNRMWGCSPDALVDDDPAGPGGVELKCPDEATHLLYLLRATEDEIPGEYRAQVHGSIWTTGRAWWDFVSYCPGLPEVRVRVWRDPQWHDAFEKTVPAFATRILHSRELLRDAGTVFQMDEQQEDAA